MNNRNTFPKLETGMVVRVMGGSSQPLGPYLVVGDRVLAAAGWEPLRNWKKDGAYEDESWPMLDIVAVYGGEEVYSLKLERCTEELTPIWELKEQCPTQAKIAELEETIKKASQQIQQLKEEMNV